MARIKHTKNELKSQRDAERRYQRYLPTLQLKKQQLQMEMRNLEQKRQERRDEEGRVRDRLAPWIRLFTEDFDFPGLLRIRRRVIGEGNIAGVAIPVLETVEFDSDLPDLLATPPWVDDGLRALKELARLRMELDILDRQHGLLANELRVTTQRVNLFEKVKIPEASENIRVIRIFLGDMQTAEVARAKLAKGKALVREGKA